MKVWWQDPIVWLMFLCAGLLSFLTFSWLHSSYNREVNNIVQDGNHRFGNAIRSLEDSLLQASFDLEIENKIPEGRDLRILRMRLDSTMAKESSAGNKKMHLRARRHKARVEHKGDILGSLSMPLAINDGSFFSDNTDIDSLADMAFILLQNHLGQSFTGYSGTYDLKNTKDTLSGSFYTRSFFDLYSNTSYHLSVTPTRMEALKAISKQIATVVITMILTIMAFVLTYRTLQKHRRLSLMQKELISNISHELNTPISTVRVALEALDKFKVNDDQKKRAEYLEISKNELNRLSLLVDSVLKSVTSDAQDSISVEKLELSSLINDILKTMQLRFDQAGAEVQFENSGTPVFVKGDRLHITSVLYNLLDNALKYCKNKPEIKVELTHVKKNVTLKISDNGVGIPQVYLNKVFEKFFRVPSENIHNVKGYGLGLSYVAGVIKQHKGTIKAHSSPGEGSQFLINLPQADLK